MTIFQKYSLCVFLLIYPLSAIWIGTAIVNSEAVRHFVVKNQWADGCLAFTQIVLVTATMLNYIVLCFWVSERRSK